MKLSFVDSESAPWPSCVGSKVSYVLNESNIELRPTLYCFDNASFVSCVVIHNRTGTHACNKCCTYWTTSGP